MIGRTPCLLAAAWPSHAWIDRTDNLLFRIVCRSGWTIAMQKTSSARLPSPGPNRQQLGAPVPLRDRLANGRRRDDHGGAALRGAASQNIDPLFLQVCRECHTFRRVRPKTRGTVEALNPRRARCGIATRVWPGPSKRLKEICPIRRCGNRWN